MTTYTITITPYDSTATTTTLRLDTSGRDVTLTDLHLHRGSGLSTGALPAIDYGMLLQAVAASAPTPVLTAAAPARQVEAAPEPLVPAAEVVAKPSRARGSRSTRSASTAVTAPAPAAAAQAQPTTPTRASSATRATGRRAASKAAPSEAEQTPRARRAATAKKATPSAVDATKAKKTAKSAPAKKATRAASAGERAYRRMPDDFATMYQQASSAAAVADHYSVPRHTAHGWIRRLREQDGAARNR